MLRSKSRLFNYLLSVAAVTCTAVSWSSPSDAFVQQFVVDQTATVNFRPIPLGTSVPGPQRPIRRTGAGYLASSILISTIIRSLRISATRLQRRARSATLLTFRLSRRLTRLSAADC